MTLVRVDHIVSERDFGVILATTVLDEGGVASDQELRVRALRGVMVGDPAVGETWSVEGAVMETQWGPQIEATHAARRLPSGELVRAFLAAHVPGVGPERADRLWAAYGTDLPDVLLAGDLAEIGRVIAPDRPLLGPRIAAAVVRAWKDADGQARLVAWLQGCGVADMRVVARIHAVLGDAAAATLARNPWTLVPLLRWEQVDALGCRLLREAGASCVEDAPDRLVGAVDASVKAVIATGDTVVTDEDLRAEVARRLNVAPAHARVGDALSVGLRNGAIVPDDNGMWRAPGCALMEEAVVRRLRTMLDEEEADGTFQAWRRAEALAAFEDASGTLHPEQRAAVLDVLASPVSCLRGGAGTGKTFVTRAICHVWEAGGGDVVLSALAGKAALRLSRATGRLARTLFRTMRELDERPRIKAALMDCVDRPGQLRLEARLSALAEITPRSLVIVDEASMVDLATMHGLLRRMPPGARLLLVGDERQLPPVGFGMVFHRLVADAGITTSLEVIHRQSDASGIPFAAAAVRERSMPAMKPYAGLADGVSLLAAKGAEAIEAGVLRAFQDLASEETLIVAPTRSGGVGVSGLNETLHELHLTANPGAEMVSPLGERFSVGEPVLHERNDYARNLYNGSLGMVTGVGGGVLTTEFDGEEHRFDRDETIDLSLGYAMTCHRAQGSQACRVIIALTPSRPLDPSWLYTALTRAERQVVIVGDAKTMSDVLGMEWAAERRKVGLQWSSPTADDGTTTH
ncbi:AAA family ATPase [Methylobacterium brachiatum]|uniref:AAA family ATPase n=1 Tax=Methylobacterium brachiatum TaxID=269660 RepID=UPI00244A5DD5|nr:AAA family ATPase [Methylobacterium brachiatum]MDH2310863.1 AAA family ATPase [Methylobacterium brachiatum]